LKKNSESKNSISASTSAEAGAFTRNVVWIAMAQVFTSLIFGIATLPALTKHYSPEVYGVWVQTMVTVTLLSPVVAMELDMAVVRFLSGEVNKTATRRVLGSMLYAILACSLLIFTAVNIFSEQLSMVLFADPRYSNFVRLTFLWVIMDALFVFFSSYFRARKRIRTISIRQIVYSTAIMAIVVGFTSFGFDLEWIIVGAITVEGLLAFIFFLMITWENGPPLLDLAGLKQFLAFSLPQIPGTALLWLIGYSDRYFITHFLNLSQAGIYSSSSQLAGLTRLFYTPVCYVLYPALSKLWDEKRFADARRYLQQSIRFLLTLGIPASVGIALLSQPMLKVLTTSEFLAGSEIVFFLSAGAIFLGIFQINEHVILLTRRTRLLPFIISSGAVASIVMNIILIPHIGITGAAVANMFAYLVLAAIVTLIARKETGYAFDFKSLAKTIGATIPMAACLYFIKVDSIGGIILAAGIGALVFVAGLLLLRAFSVEEISLIRKTVGTLLPGYSGGKNKI
jgi:O-antigen/teichoic acid export membrane protein